MTTRSALPNQTVANAFIILRVPERMPITKDLLMTNVKKDISRSLTDHGFLFSTFSRRASPERTLKFMVDRGLLEEHDGLISRNNHTKKYLRKLPETVTDLLEPLPVCDPLTLIAGAGNER